MINSNSTLIKIVSKLVDKENDEIFKSELVDDLNRIEEELLEAQKTKEA